MSLARKLRTPSHTHTHSVMLFRVLHSVQSRFVWFVPLWISQNNTRQTNRSAQQNKKTRTSIKKRSQYHLRKTAKWFFRTKDCLSFLTSILMIPIFAFLTTKSYFQRYAAPLRLWRLLLPSLSFVFFLPFLDFLFDLCARIFVAMQIISCAQSQTLPDGDDGEGVIFLNTATQCMRRFLLDKLK